MVPPMLSDLVLSLSKKAGEAPVRDLEGNSVEKIDLPPMFSAPLRLDLVRRVYVHVLTARFQPKGASKFSGHKYSVEGWGAGYGMARISRIRGRGTAKSMGGGFVPTSVGGRPTHPPKSERVLLKKVNRKEKLLALASAIAYTAYRESVTRRGHRIPSEVSFPIIVKDELEAVSSSKILYRTLRWLGLEGELERCSRKTIRAGKGKLRGRRYKKAKGPLIIYSTDNGLVRAASNIPGVETVSARELGVLHLAPGAMPGRLVVWTKTALAAVDQRMREAFP